MNDNECGNLGHDTVPGDGLEPLPELLDHRILCPGDGARMDRGETEIPAADDHWPKLWHCYCCRRAYAQAVNGALSLVGTVAP